MLYDTTLGGGVAARAEAAKGGSYSIGDYTYIYIYIYREIYIYTHYCIYIYI